MSNLKPRGTHGRFVKSPHTAERQAKAVEMRSKGLSYAKIGAELKCTAQGAVDLVRGGLAQVPPEKVDQVRQVELQKYDLYEQAAWRVLEAYHFHVISSGPQAGTVVRDPSGEGYLFDDAPVLAALDRLLKIAGLRSKLLGLDAPIKHRVEVLTEDEVDRAIAQLNLELAELPPSSSNGHSANGHRRGATRKA